MAKGKNSLPENNMYIRTLSGRFEEMMEKRKEMQSVQHLLINIGKDNNSLPENSMYIICTLSGMFEEMVERGPGKEIQSVQHRHKHGKRQQLTY